MEFKKIISGKTFILSLVIHKAREELLKTLHPGTLAQKETKITKRNYEGFHTLLNCKREGGSYSWQFLICSLR